MEQLKELLGVAVGRATFDVGRIVWREGGDVISYASRPQELVTPQQLSQMIAAKGWRAKDFRRASRARLIVCDRALLELERHVRFLLQDYVDPETDRIGHAFPTGGNEESYSGHPIIDDDSILNIRSWSSPVASFTKALVKGASVVGTKTVVCQLLGWLEGDEPVKYRTAAILNGVAFTEPLASLEGVHIEPLPLSSDELPVHLPQLSGMSADDYMGRTVLYIDYEASPALFRPGASSLVETFKVRNVADVGFDIACEAMSLESDTCVETGFYWCHYEGLPGLTEARDGNSWSFDGKRYESWHLTTRGNLIDRYSEGVGTLLPDGSSGPLPAEERLIDTLRAIKALGAGHPVRTSISRWMKSKGSRNVLVDSFIDLRIALETLYLQDFLNETTSQEMRFRLPLFGAWHLGSKFEDRQNIRKQLRDSYDTASVAVHGGSISHVQKEELLSTGQGLCRRGIYKMLNEGPPDDWGDLILGAEYANPCSE